MFRPRIAPLRRHEAGAVLVIGMLALALLTIIGVAATNTGSLESEISGNEKAYQQAFYASELALVSGESILETLANRATLNEGSTVGRYTQGTLSFQQNTTQLGKLSSGIWQPLQWNSSDSAAVINLPDGLSKLGAVPRYTIQPRSFKSDSLGRGIAYGETGIYYFTIAALGTGGDKASNVLLETIYAKRY